LRFQVLTTASMKIKISWDVGPRSPFGVDRRFIALMVEAVRTSETSVYSNETMLRYIPEGSNLLYFWIFLN
jgi:hypothetical protein